MILSTVVCAKIIHFKYINVRGKSTFKSHRDFISKIDMTFEQFYQILIYIFMIACDV